MKLKSLLLTLSLLLLSIKFYGQCVTTNNLVTPMNQNNGQRGIMFDVVAINNITINCFEVNMATGTSGVNIYFKAGTHVGFQNNAAAWTLLGTAPAVAGLGNNLFTVVPININVPVSPQCTVAFYITRTNSTGPTLQYTNGTALGAVLAADANLRILQGTGKDFPFGLSFQPRNFNGRIRYNLNGAGPQPGNVVGPTAVCAGSTNVYTLSSTGWTSYNWTVPAGSTIVSGQNTNSITVTAGSTSGNVCVTPSGPCGPAAQTCLAVTQAPNPTSTAAQTNVSCLGGTNGTATINPSPAGVYTYQWSPSGGTNQTATGLAAGVYTVTASNAGNCRTIQTITITQPATSVSAAVTPTNVLCNGQTNGAVAISTSGGANPVTFLWSNGRTTSNNSGLAAGTYTVTVSDGNGCTTTRTTTVTQPSLLTTSSVPANILCNSAATGSIDLTVSGGTATYNYSWSNGSTTQDISQLSAGSYNVTITDINGCTSTNGATITQPSAITLSTVPSNVSCFGGNNGTANLNINGGTNPYSYNWSNGQTTEDLSNLAIGTYNVTVTDNNNCTSTSSVALTQPTAVVSSTTVTNVLCNAASGGAVNLSVSGGVSNYTFNWSNGANVQNISGLNAGTYQVTITDNNGCTSTNAATVTQPTALNSNTTQANVLCNAASTGFVNLTVSGGTSAYSFNWSNGSNTQNISNLSAGVYTVTITDANLCTLTNSATVTEPTVLNASNSVLDILCNGFASGSVNSIPSGGVSNYNFQWSNGATNQNISGLSAGTYTLTLTDANGCTFTNSSTVNQPTAVLSNATVNNVLCNAAAGGDITLTVNGGVPTYSFNWSNGATTQNISGLTSGSYNVTITDNNGCTSTNGATITQPTAIVNNTTVTNVLCNSAITGAVNLAVNGGTGTYTFNWSNGTTSQNLSGIPAGNYSVTITDTNGCTASNAVTVTQPNALTNTNNVVNVLCNGRPTGSISTNPVGGVPGYIYRWSNNRTTQNLTGLLAGTYIVTITDANGCSLTNSITVTQPTALTASTTAQNALCNGSSTGSVNLTISGGTTSYSFNWNNGRTTEDISGLVAGIYLVTVTDGNGCTTSVSGVVGQPSQMQSFRTVNNALCNGSSTGSINLNINGGTPTYNFNWSNGSTTRNVTGLAAGTYQVTITDANGCTITNNGTVNEPTQIVSSNIPTAALCFGASNGAINLTVNGGTPAYDFVWSNNEFSQNISGLAAGIYTVTIEDANGCSITNTATVTEPTLLVATNNTVDILCNSASTGSVSLTVNGGTTNYNYLWSNSQTTQNISNLAAGTYSVTVTDANACATTSTATLTEPAALVSSNTFVNVSCNGGANGSVDLTVTGGITNYSYAWSNGANTQDISGLSIGTYNVTITDANGCTNTSSAVVSEPILLTSSNTFVNILCNGGNNGSVDLTVTGGVINYTYNWSNGLTTQDISGLTAGIYTVTVTDANGCQTLSTANIVEPTQLTVSALPVNILCNAASTGSISLNVNGGTTAYNYSWSNGANTQDLNNVIAGVYTATITDANGCSLTSTSILTEPTTLTTSNTFINVSCNGGNNGSVDLIVNGGVTNYSYAWSNGANTQDLSGLAIGTYEVTVTDANGCTNTSSATVTEPTLLTTSNTFLNVLCNGGNNGSVDLTVNGGASGYTYNWNNGQTTQDLSGLTAGTYSVVVTDANSCTTTNTILITEPSQINSNTITVTDATCSVGGTVNISVNGGAGGYTYFWSNTNTTEDISGLSAGSYSVTITDLNGCTLVNGPNNIQSIGTPAATLNNFVNLTCNGSNNGSIDIIVNGGVPGYTFNWSNGANTEDLNNLPAGTYSLTVIDNIGCIATVNSINITEPNVLSLSNTSTNALCNRSSEGSISINVLGGTTPYNYLWSNGANTEDLSALSAGTYTLTLTDNNGCQIISNNISISDPSAIFLSNISVTNANCGQSNGAIDIVATGGTPGYTFIWTTGDSGSSITGLLGDDYIVTVTDNNGCTYTNNIFVANSLDIIVDIIHTDELCNQPGSGTMEVVLTGGTPPYNIAWNNGETSQSLTNVFAGTYSVNVTDNNSCFDSDTVIITTPFQPLTNAAVLPSLSVDTTIMWNDITSVTSGSNQSQNGVNYNWTFSGPGNPNFTNSNLFQTEINPEVDGEYFLYVTATSAEGCTDTDTIRVFVEAFDPRIPTAFSPNGDNSNEIFQVLNLDKELIKEFKIYNRWGQLIYDNAIQAAWDGKFNNIDQPREVYMFHIVWKSPDQAGETIKRGHVTLFR
jgi:gliding motility-associated-like protein